MLLAELSPIVCYRIVLYNETPRSAWTVSEANYTVPSYRIYVLKTSLLYTRLRAVNVRASSLKLVYSKQPILGLTQEFCLVRVGWRVAFETIKLIHAKVLLLCTIFDINYQPNIAHINMQGPSVLVLT